MPVYPATGLVLRRASMGEADRILTLFTAERGKLSAVAKGSRRVTSRLTGATEPFTLSRFLLATGRSLDIVTQCEIRNAFSGLRQDLPRLARATFVCELLDRFTIEHDDSAAAELLECAVRALALLERTDTDLDIALHAFELRMLDIQGYAPALDRCVRCGNSVAGGRVGFSPSLGGALCAEDRYRADDAFEISAATLAVMTSLVALEDEELSGLHPDPQRMAEVARAMRWYVRYRLDRDLKSAEFLDQLRAAEPSGR
jgi:DNA repair protein RecO (recombination protein O)